MLGTPAKATIWLVSYTHKHGDELQSHRGFFLTSDPTGAGLYEVVRQAVPVECRGELTLREATRHGDASGLVTLTEPKLEAN